MHTWPGNPYPLGATYDGSGTNFALFSEVADRVELCLFDDAGNEECVDLVEVDAHVWHAYLPNVAPGQEYGFRVHAPYDPENGLRGNPHKLLLDPYAKATSGEIDWDQALFSYTFGDPDSTDDQDSAPHMMKGVVINPFFDWQGDRSPGIPYGETVIYEAHVKGLTETHPDVPEEQRGTYAGVAHRRSSSTSSAWASRRSSSCPCTSSSTTPHCRRRDCRTTGATTPSGSSRRTRTTRPPATGTAGAGVQGDGPRAAPCGHRGRPRRGLQPHRRGEPPRADPVVPGHRQRRVLPPGRGRQAVLQRHHRHGQLAQRRAPALAAAHHGLAPVLGDRDARRRLPLRPRGRPGP